MNWLYEIFGFIRSFQFWVVIAPWESALLVRLGKSAKVLKPGPHLRIPWLDRIFVQSVRLRTISDTGQTMTTKDGKVLTLSVLINYAIADIRKLYMSVSNPESTLLGQVQGLIAQIVATTPAAQITPSLLEDGVTKKMPSTEWGLSEVKLMVTTFAFVKTYRLLNAEYRSFSGANDLDNQLTAVPRR